MLNLSSHPDNVTNGTAVSRERTYAEITAALENARIRLLNSDGRTYTGGDYCDEISRLRAEREAHKDFARDPAVIEWRNQLADKKNKVAEVLPATEKRAA